MVPRSEREGDEATVEAVLRDVRHVSVPGLLRLLARGDWMPEEAESFHGRHHAAAGIPPTAN